MKRWRKVRLLFKRIEIMYQDIKLCAKYGENRRPSCAPQTKWLHQGCGLSPYLFNIFISDIIDYIDKEQTHSPVIPELKIPGLLFADDLAVASFASYGSQKKVERVDQYCDIVDQHLRHNLSKCKKMLFKKRR
jgi:hypothetical protein